MLTEQRLKARGTMASAAAKASKRPDDPELLARAEQARRDYYAIALEDHIARVIAEAPELLPEQQERLAALLRAAPAARGGGAG